MTRLQLHTTTTTARPVEGLFDWSEHTLALQRPGLRLCQTNDPQDAPQCVRQSSNNDPEENHTFFEVSADEWSFALCMHEVNIYQIRCYKAGWILT